MFDRREAIVAICAQVWKYQCITMFYWRKAMVAACVQVWMYRNVDRREAIVAFRGTEQVKWKDLATDLQLSPCSLNPERVNNNAGLPLTVKLLKQMTNKEEEMTVRALAAQAAWLLALANYTYMNARLVKAHCITACQRCSRPQRWRIESCFSVAIVLM